MERITHDPTKSLTKDELASVSDLENHEGWQVLIRITEDYVRGVVVDDVLGSEGIDPTVLLMTARGIAKGARWVIDRQKVAKKRLVDGKKTE